jgi:hypothetical protein
MASPDLAAAREHFLGLVAEVRPDLHRYVSRLVGSAIDGEDVVQDLAKAFYALSLGGIVRVTLYQLYGVDDSLRLIAPAALVTLTRN